MLKHTVHMPFSAMSATYHIEDDGHVAGVTYEQDCSAWIDNARESASDRSNWEFKSGGLTYRKVAEIPHSVCMELLAKGLNPYNPENRGVMQDVLKEIRKNYPLLLTCPEKHAT
jgi:hypothetical protein